MTVLWVDCETASSVDIGNGVDAYAQDARLLLVTYALDDGPVKAWQLGRSEPAPKEFMDAFADPSVELIAHNARFERVIFSRHGWGRVPITRWRCSMAQAYAHGMPGALEDLGRFLGLPDDEQKLADGKRLIKLFCEPPFADPHEHPEDWNRFVEYGKQDVATMRACVKRMPNINYPKMQSERDLWVLDQKINDRGFAVDLDLAHAAIAAIDREKLVLDERVKLITGGVLRSGTQREKLQHYLDMFHGVELDNMQKSTLNAATPDLEGDALTLLNIRLDVSRASTAKYQRLIEAQVGGRLKGSMQFCGAERTGRWAGRIFQPLNLPRPTMDAEQIELGIEALKAGCADLVTDSVYELCSNSLRGVVIAPPGKLLQVADWNAIEGRVLAWLAGEKWVLDAYREGRDMYIETYCRVFGVPAFSKKDPRRQHGKVMDLFYGYQGGAGAAVTGARSYNVDLREMSISAWDQADDEVREGAHWMWEWAGERDARLGLEMDVYLGLQCAKIMWRNIRPATVKLWHQLEAAAKAAIQQPGTAHYAGKCAFMCSGTVLAIRLPTGRLLFYHQPRLSVQLEPGEEPEDVDADILEKRKKGITFLMARGYRRPLYGGLITENITQAFSREILARALPRVEAAGYEVVLHVYDEIVAEVPEAWGESDPEALKLCALLCEPHPAAPDLPLAAEGATLTRYRKT